jgi:proline dehydrogenase
MASNRVRTLSSIPLDESTSQHTDSRNAEQSPPQQQPTQDNSNNNNNNNSNPMPDFNDAEAAYESKTNPELIRAMLSFGLCQIPILVRYSERLLKLGRKIVGDTITDGILKQTLFGHFCAGEDEKQILPAIHKLEKAGIGSILDFAAEDDGEGDDGDDGDRSKKEKIADEIIQDKSPKVRVYDYESEAKCDRHVETFHKCIRDVADLGKDGYAAIKVTALTNPKLLERMSRAIVEAQNLFAKFDENGDGIVTKDEFKHGFNLFFKGEDAMLNDALDHLQLADGSVDYITWSMLLTPSDLPRLTAGCREVGPLSLAAPTDEEIELMERMFERGHELARQAAEVGTRLLIDAEQARFQPAIDNFVLNLQRTYNATGVSEFPVIYNTYQCYLKDVPDRLRTDVERSERFDYHFGAKLVRGAYMESERALAKSLGFPSPIQDTIQDTHDCYNNSVDFLLKHAIQSDKTCELMLATHNQESIEKAIHSMNEHGVNRKDPTICFGQLFGMSDNLTFNLGRHGYRAYKYVPYGEVKMVMPYLIRRANENSSIASGAAQELRMIQNELKRRVRGRRTVAG